MNCKLQVTFQVALGSRVLVMGGYTGATSVGAVEEYLIQQNVWKQTQYGLMTPRHVARAVPVPAAWFNHLPGGCKGVM